MKNKIVIDLDKLVVSADKVGEFALNGEGEDLIIELKKARDQVDELYKKALANVYEQALEYDKNAKAIDGHKVRITFSPSGAKYVAQDIEKLEDRFKKVELKLNTDEIETYYEEHLELPTGVETKPDRGVSIRLVVKKNATDDAEESLQA